MDKTYVNEGYAEEESSCGVEFSFFDTDKKTPVTPLTLSYTVVDEYKNVVNNKENITITPQQKVLIVLKEDDLSLSKNGIEQRYVIVKGTYNSSTLGVTNFKTQHEFTIKPLKHYETL